MSQAPQNQKYWVILGASAGGLEALKDFLSNYKEAHNSYLIIAQHLDPKHPTILKDLLARATDLPIVLLERDTRPEPGHIYIISPGHNATMLEDVICLSPAAEVGPKPSIDIFLNSVAENIGEKAIAVILSGTGTDGAQGVMAIKSANGVVFAQDNRSAKYSGMPNAAIDTGAVDLILPPGELAEKVSRFIQTSDRSFEAIANPPSQSSMDKLFQRIFDQTGYDFSGYKSKTIKRRIARRMAVHRMMSLDDYLALLQTSTQEVESLFKDFLISVTAFFRDHAAFQDLAKVIDDLVAQTPDSNVIRVWVPGCANGEEAYSIAILLQQALIQQKKQVSFQVFASDIDEVALNQARKGTYSPAQVNDIDPKILESFFHPVKAIFWFQKPSETRWCSPNRTSLPTHRFLKST